MTNLFDTLSTAAWLIETGELPEKIKIEQLSYFAHRLIDILHDTDHATHHFSELKKTPFNEMVRQLDGLSRTTRKYITDRKEYHHYREDDKIDSWYYSKMLKLTQKSEDSS